MNLIFAPKFSFCKLVFSCGENNFSGSVVYIENFRFNGKIVIFSNSKGKMVIYSGVAIKWKGWRYIRIGIYNSFIQTQLLRSNKKYNRVRTYLNTRINWVGTRAIKKFTRLIEYPTFRVPEMPSAQMNTPHWIPVVNFSLFLSLPLKLNHTKFFSQILLSTIFLLFLKITKILLKRRDCYYYRFIFDIAGELMKVNY